MVNIDDFIKRLEIILDYYNLSASAFADKIGVQRSSLSHLLSGRNKPSLDFIIKVIEVFPDVDLYWVLNGKGTFPKSEIKNLSIEEKKPIIKEEVILQDQSLETDLFSAENSSTPENEIQAAKNSQHTPPTLKNDTAIERIVIFFKDGTFKNYTP
ncbi:helix-turn-helix transcriptional regulator [Flavobacterium psychraquaticum]|uniref:helix-turn-helix domain-containing protein n=1 Tax=Flavobacterium psychraquaticum TaxID=3103958 RepID=UPI002ACD8C6B|nr:helix-turn-helix transcriptional regulator [Flavobacterium sp. LB-N7T]